MRIRSCMILLLAAALLGGCQAKPVEAALPETEATPLPEANQANIEEEITVTQNPVVTIEMEDGGVIKAELYYDVAPNTVKNFVYLANSGYYDGVIFHRVIPGFMIQGGDPDGTGMGGPGYRIKGEFTNNKFQNDLLHERGVLSMARKGSSYAPASAYNTAGSQFFIMHADSPHLDQDYAAFGKVIEGMDVVDAIANAQTGRGNRPVADQRMKKVTAETFGVDLGEPERIYD